MKSLARIFLLVGGLGWLVAHAAATRPPNVIIILCDDLGYGDLGAYGHPSIRTPRLDRMAAEGLRFTDFYSPSSICTPSRAALLTGRYAVRSGMCNMGNSRGVLFPDSKGGLPQSEITLAKGLKARGYATLHVGKWHLGIHPGGQPQDHGFDHSLGLPYSNDMDRQPETVKGSEGWAEPPATGWNVPLVRDGQVQERPADQSTLTRRYTEEAVRFISENKQRPFFLYLAHTFPHVPMFASAQFKGKSRRGIYGDAVEELDWSTGQVLDALQQAGIAENTLVIFTSDNGPWLIMGEQGGSSGLLRDGKGSTWEGGQRVPAIAWWPGQIQPGITNQVASGMDLFTTVLSLAGAAIPADRAIDGVDLSALLLNGRPVATRPFFFYRDDKIFACRLGEWKAHFASKSGVGGSAQPAQHEPPLLYHLGRDPSEQYDVAAQNPAVIQAIRAVVKQHEAGLIRGEPQLN